MPTKEHDLKMRLVSVLKDLQEDGGKDPEAIWLIGSLAASLVDKAKAKTWPELKNALKREEYDRLLLDFQTQGNALYQAGEIKRAYACQALGLSLVCRTQRADMQMREGESLLDSLIDGATKIYRRTQRPN